MGETDELDGGYGRTYPSMRMTSFSRTSWWAWRHERGGSLRAG
jgi:hypothetical protein